MRQSASRISAHRQLWAGAAAGRGGGDADGDKPQAGAGLALAVYQGPDGYPLRFAHLLTAPRRASAYFRFDEETQSFDHYIVGAPSRVPSSRN